MVVTRSLQLTVKKDSRSLKTLEGNLSMRKDGEKTSVSTRVAELDQIVPQYLGVSRAVLDNVVFCHQDESLWPLSEPSVLKKKFDEIFEALKYTKAVDNIKVLRKKQNEELGKLKIIEEQEKINKDRSEKAERRSETLSAEIQKMRDEYTRLEKLHATAQENAHESWNSAAQFEQIVTQLNGKRTEARLKQESIQDAKQDLQEMEDSDEDLRSLLQQYDHRAMMYSSEIEDKMRQYHAVDKRKIDIQNELGRKQRDHGKFQAEKSQHDRQIHNRKSLVKEVAARHNLRGFELDISEDQIQTFMERILKLARDQRSVSERARQESQQELSEAQAFLSRLQEQRSALNQNRENSKSQVDTGNQKIQSYNTRLSLIDTDEGAQARLQSNIDDIQDTLQTAKARFEGSKWDEKIAEAERGCRDVEKSKEALDADVLQATKQAKETAQIDYLHRTLKETNQSLTTMEGAHGGEISRVLGNSWKSDLERTYEAAVKQRTVDLQEAEKMRDRSQNELWQLESKIQNVKDNISEKSVEIRNCEFRLREGLEDEAIAEYPSVVENWEKSRETQFADMQLATYYQKCRNHLEKKNACYTCKRQFEQGPDPSRQGLVERLEKALDREIQAMQTELDETSQTVTELRNLGPVFETWSRLSQKEVPGLTNELARLEQARTDLNNKLEREHDRKVEECKEAVYEISKLNKTVQAIVKDTNQVTVINQQLQELSQKYSQAGAMSQGLESIAEKQRMATEQYRASMKAVEKLRNERDNARNQLNTLEIEVRDAKDKLNDATTALREKQNVQGLINELLASNREQREQMRLFDQQQQDLEPKIAQSQARLDEIRRRGDERQNQLSTEESRINQSVDQLRHAQNEIQAYIDRNGPQQLMEVEREIDNIKRQQSDLEMQIHQLTVDINKLKKEESSHSEMKRSIERNLKYRSNLRSLEQLRSEIAELESHNAEADADFHTREASKWQNERNRLAADQASVTGQMKSKDDQLSDLLREFNTDFKDAKYKYREATIKVQATKAVVDDLGRYGGALDKAIMKYHSLKMDEINTLIEELWQKTYQGTDIDTILIRSDSEGAKGNKSYNYRVCMIKENVEMDMRGRCSAGQKVLASIIIRLALAECFGVSCGLIALDEPTTNLDHDNIVALARALNGIIKVRREQSNFQLIVITHDENFLREMHCSDFCDYYFRIHRNERQKSQIDKQSIAEVM